MKLTYVLPRLGLTFLPPRVATWRYKRGNRSLLANLSSGDTVGATNSDMTEEMDQEENVVVPDEIEEVIDQLIQGLRSMDSIVRYIRIS